MLNGYLRPKFIIYDLSYSSSETYILDLCDEEGLIEDYPIDSIEHDLPALGTREQLLLGINPVFTLNYGSYSSTKTTQAIFDIVNAFLSNQIHCFLYPREDSRRCYRVILDTANSISIGLLKGLQHAKGHKGIKISFIAKEAINAIDYDTLANPVIAFHKNPSIAYI